MVKAPYVDKDGLKKGAWSVEEDEKLRAYIVRYGHWNWRLLPKFAGLQRCGKSCRLRWMNYLRPGVKRGDFSQEEKELIAKLHQENGNKWSAIATKLPGRTDNDIKNYWQTHLQRSSKLGQGLEARNCRNGEEVSGVSEVSTSNSRSYSRKHENSKVPSEIYILESSSSNSVVSNTAFGWDLNLSVEQNGHDIL